MDTWEHWQKLYILIQILFGKSKFKCKKIGILFKGIFAFWFKRYDTNSVKNRMNYLNNKKQEE